MRINWSVYEAHAEHLASLVDTFAKKRKALMDPMYSLEYQQEQVRKLRDDVKPKVWETLAGIRAQVEKDAEAARYRPPEMTPEERAAHFAERTYWATVLPDTLASMGPDAILAEYERVAKAGSPAQKAEFERVAERLLAEKGSVGHRARFGELKRAAMSPEEKEAERAQAAVETISFYYGWLEHQTRNALELIENGGTLDTRPLAQWAATVRKKVEQAADKGKAS